MPFSKIQSAIVRSSLRTTGLLLAGLLISATWGCGEKSTPVVSSDMDPAPITSDDLGVPAGSLNVPGEHPLDTSMTKGRFPAGLSVARVIASRDVSGGDRGLCPDEIPIDRAAHWNQVMDTLPPVREVTLLHQLGIDPRGANREDFLLESTRINCNLCLLFGRSEDSQGDAELIGVLWDARASRPLSAFRVPIVPDPALLAKCKEDDAEGIVRIMREADASAEQELRAMVRDNIWDMVKRDQIDTTTRPSPWRGEDTQLPRDRDPFRRIEELLRQEGRR